MPLWLSSGITEITTGTGKALLEFVGGAEPGDAAAGVAVWAPEI